MLRVFSYTGKRLVLVFSQLFASLGIGLLIGLLVGLSASPVVGMLVGAVTALLASLLGIKLPEKNGEQESLPQQQQRTLLTGLRAGMFGVACIAGLFTGMLIRTHNWLSPPAPTLLDYKMELLAAGLSEPDVNQLVKQRAGVPASSAAAKPAPTAQDSVLFGVSAELCEKLPPRRFATLQAAADYYRNVEQTKLAELTETLIRGTESEAQQRSLLTQMVDLICTDA